MGIDPIVGHSVAPKFKAHTKFSQRVIPRFEGGLTRKNLKDGVVESFEDVVILGGARTPFGKFNGPLKNVTASDLLGTALKGTMEKTGIDPKDVRQILIGNIIANDPQQPFMPRAMGIRMGIKPGESIAMEVNRLCGTGFEVARQAAQQVTNGGEDAIILTGGVENMTKTPVMDTEAMMLYETVSGTKKFVAKKLTGIKQLLGKFKIMQAEKALRDHLLNRPYQNPIQHGLTDPSATLMLGTADNLAARFNITRSDIDDYAHLSQMRYQQALKDGRFDDEIVPIKADYLSSDSRLKKGTTEVTADSHPRPGERKKLDKLPALEAKNRSDAIHTAANSSGIVDGAAAVAITSGVFAAEKNLPILAQLKSVAVTGCDPNIMGFGPARAVPEALKAAGVSLEDVDFVEINEAFAGQVLACAKEIVKGTTVTTDELLEKLNVDGGSIPIGHPLSASGSRILLHAANRLRDDNKQYAVVSACIGGGQGIAMVIENPAFNPNG